MLLYSTLGDKVQTSEGMNMRVYTVESSWMAVLVMRVEASAAASIASPSSEKSTELPTSESSAFWSLSWLMQYCRKCYTQHNQVVYRHAHTLILVRALSYAFSLTYPGTTFMIALVSSTVASESMNADESSAACACSRVGLAIRSSDRAEALATRMARCRPERRGEQLASDRDSASSSARSTRVGCMRDCSRMLSLDSLGMAKIEPKSGELL